MDMGKHDGQGMLGSMVAVERGGPRDWVGDGDV